MSIFRSHLLRSAALIMAVLAIGSVQAGEVNSSAGTSAFSFLKINVGARPVALGGAFTGLANDETALYYNPAGIATLESSRYVLGYHNYFVDMQSGFVGYIRPLNEKQTLGFYASYLNYGTFTETDLQGNVTGDFGGGDFLLAATFAMRQTRLLSVGATAKFIRESIQDYSAMGIAFDIGARYSTDRGRYTAGVMVQNLGAQLSSLGEGEKDGLPITLRSGGSAKPKGLPLMFVGDVIVPLDNDIDFAVGAEYYELQPLYIRVGWNSFGSNYRADDSDDGLAGLSMGVGFDYNNMQLSYAFTPAADLGESHRITLTGGI
ncbi:MAG: PorV/PorQ family protein [bacterium]|nr:PorV/PorQ family protein [bacterium]